MNETVFVIVCLSVVVALSAVLFVLMKDRKSLKKEISNLTSELYKAKQNATCLADYITNLQKIKADEKSTSDKIKEAKNDEEVYRIISDLIKSNNDKLYNKTEG